MACARAIIAKGRAADCARAMALMDKFTAQNLMVDKGDVTDAIAAQARRLGSTPVMYPKRNSKEQRGYDTKIHKARHVVGNAFHHLERWRRATRYPQNTISFLPTIHIRASFCGF